MKYKINDRVRIKTWKELEEEYKLKSMGNIVLKNDMFFNPKMKKYCGKIMTIAKVNVKYNRYAMKEDDEDWSWTDEMIKGLNGRKVAYIDYDEYKDGSVVIKGWENVIRVNKLPEEYINKSMSEGKTFFYETHLSSGKFIFVRIKRHKQMCVDIYRVGDKLPREEFKYFIKNLKEAGQNLTDFNNKPIRRRIKI